MFHTVQSTVYTRMLIMLHTVHFTVYIHPALSTISRAHHSEQREQEQEQQQQEQHEALTLLQFADGAAPKLIDLKTSSRAELYYFV